MSLETEQPRPTHRFPTVRGVVEPDSLHHAKLTLLTTEERDIPFIHDLRSYLPILDHRSAIDSRLEYPRSIPDGMSTLGWLSFLAENGQVLDMLPPSILLKGPGSYKLTRSLHFVGTDLDGSVQQWSVSGIGTGLQYRSGGEPIMLIQPPLPVQQGLRSFCKENELPTMGTEYIAANGKPFSPDGEIPVGTYTLKDRDTKIRNTSTARQLQLEAAVPEYVAWGTYPGLEYKPPGARRGEPVGWLISKQPVELSPTDLLIMQQYYKADGLLNGFYYHLAKIVRKLNNRNFVHNQLHPGNIGWDFQNSMPVISDWETLQDISKHGRKKLETGLSPWQTARRQDLTGLILGSMKTNALNGINQVSIAKACETAAWIIEGYLGYKEESPDLERVAHHTREATEAFELSFNRVPGNEAKKLMGAALKIGSDIQRGIN